MEYLEGLNKKQKQAVLHTSGPLLILAGAGAGKTKTLTHRMLHLIHQGIHPHNILAITFTNKASKEMKERISSLIEKDKSLAEKNTNRLTPFVATFHSLGVHIIRNHAQLFGLTRHFNIYDRSDSISLVKKILKEIGEDPKHIEPKNILSVISKEKGNMKTYLEYSAESESSGYHVNQVIARVWEKYHKKMREEKALDFDDLLLEPTLLLKKDESIRKIYQEKWHHIHIDEYQDTNEVQYQLAKMISGDKKNICAVGDIDQNIYSWRGATIKNILGFEKDYPNSTLITLEQNYRSTGNILEAANDVIEKNVNRRDKKLFTENKSGDKISIYNAFDEGDEARFIADKSKNLINDGVDPSQIAVLYRANFQSRVLEEQFLHNGINYQVLGTRFFDRKEIKDVLAYIKAALNRSDLQNISRVVNNPTRGIGKVSLLKILEGKPEELSGKAKESFDNFERILKEIHETILDKEKTPSDVIKKVIKISGLEDSYIKGGEDGLERLENVKELATLAKKYESLDETPTEAIDQLLEDAALASDQDELQKDNGGVKLMTVHASKGLEFDYVFITGLEEGLFPHERFDEKKDDEEEERRLFYVAVTRAGKKLFLTYAGIRTIFGSQNVNVPSCFISDIEDHLIEYIDNDMDDVSSQAKSIFIDW